MYYTIFFAIWIFNAQVALAGSIPPDQRALDLAAWTAGCMVPQTPPIDPAEQAWLIEECLKLTPPEFKN